MSIPLPKHSTLRQRGMTRRFRLPSLHILHVRCQFCVIRAVRRNLQFLPVWVGLRKKSIVQRDGQAQERAQAKLERNRRWFERKISTFLVRAANAPVRSANAPYGELHTSTTSRSSDHERGSRLYWLRKDWSSALDHVPTGSVEVSRSAQTKKSTQFCGHTHPYLAIKASISARNAEKLCSDLLD